MDMDSYIVRFHALYTAHSNFPLNPAKAFLYALAITWLSDVKTKTKLYLNEGI